MDGVTGRGGVVEDRATMVEVIPTGAAGPDGIMGAAARGDKTMHSIQKNHGDRPLPMLLEHPDDTPSRRHGVSAPMERWQRMHGVSLIRSAWDMLLPEHTFETQSNEAPNKDVNKPSSIKAAAFASASIIFHRYYHNASLQDSDVWSTAMASTLLTAKLLEVPNMADVRKIIMVYAHLYRRRILTPVAIKPSRDNHADTTTSPMWASLRPQGTQLRPDVIQRFRKPPGMSPAGPVYREWLDALVQAEHAILRSLGFLLHWIPNRLPHKYLALVLPPGKDTSDTGGIRSVVAMRAWEYCNESQSLDLAVRVPPYSIACAAALLAQLDVVSETSNQSVPTFEPLHFHKGWGVTADDVSMVCNAMLGYRKHVRQEGSEAWMATHGFLKSLKQGDGSFNDPLSFLWSMEEDRWNQLARTTES